MSWLSRIFETKPCVELFPLKCIVDLIAGDSMTRSDSSICGYTDEEKRLDPYRSNKTKNRFLFFLARIEFTCLSACPSERGRSGATLVAPR